MIKPKAKSKLAGLLKNTQRKELLMPELRKRLSQRQRKLDKGEIRHREIVVDDAKMTIDCMKDRIQEYNHGDNSKDSRDDGEYFHPSQMGTCQRQLVFGVENAPVNGGAHADDLLRTHLTFETGTYVHVLFQNLCEALGLLEQREFQIIDHKNKVTGHADGVLNINGTKALLEIKTINSRGFTSLIAPKIEHKAQMQVYMQSLGLKTACLIYLEKDRHQVKEYVVPYDPVEYKVKNLPRIEGYFAHRRAGTLPPKEGKSPNDMPCRFCQFSKLCFNSIQVKVFEKTIKPTLVGNRPVKRSKKKVVFNRKK